MRWSHRLVLGGLVLSGAVVGAALTANRGGWELVGWALFYTGLQAPACLAAAWWGRAGTCGVAGASPGA